MDQPVVDHLGLTSSPWIIDALVVLNLELAPTQDVDPRPVVGGKINSPDPLQEPSDVQMATSQVSTRTAGNEECRILWDIDTV